MEKKYKWGIAIGLLLLLLLSLLLLTNAGIISIDTSSYGHGDSYQSNWDSFTASLGTSFGIPQDYDFTDSEGEGHCLNYECWIDAEIEYETCLDDIGMELSSPTFTNIIEYLDVMPCAYALPMGDLPDGEEFCDNAYEEKLVNECSIPCEQENYVWDGTPVTNIGEFYDNGFPNAVDSWEARCESWIHGGTWVQEEFAIGCTDAILMGCDSQSVISGGAVCEMVGYNFFCGDGNNILCVTEEI